MVTNKKQIISNTVKIDAELLKRIKKLLNDKNLRWDYPTVKHFINKAALKLLREEKG